MFPPLNTKYTIGPVGVNVIDCLERAVTALGKLRCAYTVPLADDALPLGAWLHTWSPKYPSPPVAVYEVSTEYSKEAVYAVFGSTAIGGDTTISHPPMVV